MLERTCHLYASRLSYHSGQALQCLRAESEREDVLAQSRYILSGRLTPSQLVKSVKEILASPHLDTFIGLICKPNRRAYFVCELRCLQRPSVACTIFTETANRISCFQTTRVTLLMGFSSRKVAPALTVGVPMLNMVEDRLRPVYEREASKPKWVHAELRMATYLLSHPRYDCQDCYLGISKKTCFSCGCILHGLGTFKTRGNHGKVYAQWTLPVLLVLAPRRMQSLTKSVHDLVTKLIGILQRVTPQSLKAIKESSITTPVPARVACTIFREFVPDPRDEEREAEWRRRTKPSRYGLRRYSTVHH
jgi:hypothetical protein